jgi:hypothetical protein
MGMSYQLHDPATLPPGKNPTTHWIWDWVGPITGLNVLDKRKEFLILSGIQTRDSPACIYTNYSTPAHAEQKQ